MTRHVWHDYIERAEDFRHSSLGKKTYALRSPTIERVFADAKEKHAMRYTPYRGLPEVTAWVKLKFAAMNLKKLAIHMDYSPHNGQWKKETSCCRIEATTGGYLYGTKVHKG